jgi:hypothetical protein
MSRKYLTFVAILALVGALWASVSRGDEIKAANIGTSSARDQRALRELENLWLTNEHNPKVLNRILASDFIHLVSSGDFATKEQHIAYAAKQHQRPGLKQHFQNLKVRVYGKVGIVNGIVVSNDAKGRDVRRVIFTDVFIYRDGRWQAVNAQENLVTPAQK